jgi:ribosomal protein S18 acetylase RimI-like enzyme
MARYSLRQATPADADAIAEIHIAARRDAMPWLPVLHSDAETRAWVASIVLPNHEIWVAEVDGEVVGYVARDGAELNDLYIRPCFQSRGVGTALLRAAMDRSPGELLLWTFQRNAAARRFYERHGFATIELTDGAGNEEREPDVRYRWTKGTEHEAESDDRP